MAEGNLDKDRKMEARHRILRYLSGQLEAAVASDDPCNWLTHDSNGDKLPDGLASIAKAEAEAICEELGAMTAFRIQILL